MIRFWQAALVFMGWSIGLRAEEPAKDEKKFEAPLPQKTTGPVTTLIMPYYIPSSMPRPGTREIWQYYGVDNRGRWQPRVILSPYGAYYYYNGASFPNTTSQPHLFMPYVVD
jgi:hypothetical protein